MASLIHNLQPGIIIKCSICKAPIKKLYFTHMCEYKPTRVLNGISPKVYCIICLSKQGRCKHCKLSYIMKHSTS